MESQKVVVVVEEAAAARTALQWAVSNYVRGGDSITLLYVCPATRSRKKQRSLRLRGFHLALSFKDLCNGIAEAKVEIIVTEGEQGASVLSLVNQIGASPLRRLRRMKMNPLLNLRTMKRWSLISARMMTAMKVRNRRSWKDFFWISVLMERRRRMKVQSECKLGFYLCCTEGVRQNACLGILA